MPLNIVVDELEGLYILQGEGLRQTKKYITVADLEELFKRNVAISTGELPLGTKYYSNTPDGSTVIIMERQPAKWDIKYHRRGSNNVETHNVPLPYLVFGFKYKNRTIERSMMAVSLGPITPMNPQLYQMPLGNVYNDARICWGRQRLPNISNPYQLSGLPDLFFEASFNGDLSDNAFNGYNYETNNLEHLINRLSTSETFPHDILKSWGNYNRFKQALEGRG